MSFFNCLNNTINILRHLEEISKIIPNMNLLILIINYFYYISTEHEKL